MKKIKVPRDVRDYTPKIKFFTKRQWICVIGVMFTAIFLRRLLIYFRISNVIRLFMNLGAVIFFAMYGFYEYSGMNFEKTLYKTLQHFFKSNKRIFNKEGDLFED